MAAVEMLRTKAQARPRVTDTLWRYAGGLLLFCAVGGIAVLSLFNLERYPVTWFDEGSHLHVPKTLVVDGVYADRSAEGYRFFGPTTGVGPTVLLPIAGVFKLAGIGLVQARLVMVAYLLLALAAFGALARYLYGWRIAALALALLVSMPGINLLYLGRQVLGEVPALAFLSLALLTWSRSVEAGARELRCLLLACVAFGLTALTKNQFALILVPTLLLLWAVDRLYYRALSWRQTVLPLAAVFGGAGLCQLTPLLPLLGTDELGRTLALARDASAGAIFVFVPQRIFSSLKFLFSAENAGFWVLPSLLYGLAFVRRDTSRVLPHAFLMLFAVCGLTWFAFGSIGWPRYAFPALALTTLLSARLIADVLRPLFDRVGNLRTRLRAIAVLAVVVIPIGMGLAETARSVVTARDDSPQRMAAFLNETVPQETIVETWEPEMGFLSDHAFHYPPSGWLDRAVRAKWLGGSAQQEYDPMQVSSPEYLLVGRFGKYTDAYRAFIHHTRPELIRSIGDYDLYRLHGAR
ncbi:MAG: glycosyltransferase family 39 protein [Chloroflexi bacterium]|nr:glycosyltransferase family 39 protein [Chloroflexota bacterium]